MADELAEELAASRAALEADRASAREFERATARARSSATFFQNLYEAPADDSDDDGPEGGFDDAASGSDSDGGGSSRRGRARGASSSSPSSSSLSSSSSSSSATSAIRDAALSSGPAPPGRSPVRFAVWTVAAIALTGALRLLFFRLLKARERDGEREKEKHLTTKNSHLFPTKKNNDGRSRGR